MAEDTKRVALITGASRGIGRAIALRLAKEGFKLCLNYLGNAAAAEETAELCRAAGAELIVYKADVSKTEETEAMFKAVDEAFGHIDVLVNNAGITRDGLVMRMSDEDFDAVIASNLRGSFTCMRAAAKRMLKQRSGRIVSLSSVVGLHGNAGQVNYAASKAGVIGMTKALAKELASRGITVNAIAPGFIETDMTEAMPEKAKEAIQQLIPLGGLGQVEDIAGAVAYLVSRDARYVTGQILSVDGGMNI